MNWLVWIGIALMGSGIACLITAMVLQFVPLEEDGEETETVGWADRVVDDTENADDKDVLPAVSEMPSVERRVEEGDTETGDDGDWRGATEDWSPAKEGEEADAKALPMDDYDLVIAELERQFDHLMKADQEVTDALREFHNVSCQSPVYRMLFVDCLHKEMASV